MSTLNVTTKHYPESAVIYPSDKQKLISGVFTGIVVEHRDPQTNNILKTFNADVQYAIGTLRVGYGKMSGRYMIGIKPLVISQVLPVQSFGFKAQRDVLELAQKQIIRRTGLSPYEISKLENDKLDLKGLHENTWDKLKLGYGDEFVNNVREHLKDLPSKGD